MPDHYNDERDFDDFDDDGWCGDCGECDSCWQDLMDECGLQPDGSCLLAGSEHCDFECGMRELDQEVV